MNKLQEILKILGVESFSFLGNTLVVNEKFFSDNYEVLQKLEKLKLNISFLGGYKGTILPSNTKVVKEILSVKIQYSDLNLDSFTGETFRLDSNVKNCRVSVKELLSDTVHLFNIVLNKTSVSTELFKTKLGSLIECDIESKKVSISDTSINNLTIKNASYVWLEPISSGPTGTCKVLHCEEVGLSGTSRLDLEVTSNRLLLDVTGLSGVISGKVDNLEVYCPRGLEKAKRSKLLKSLKYDNITELSLDDFTFYSDRLARRTWY